MSSSVSIYTKPILKWAGGKTQLLDRILPRMPERYNRFIEPFFGSGAVFFSIAPDDAIISDSNPELINLYRVIANDVDGLIEKLSTYKNTKEDFYEVRAQDWTSMEPLDAATRTVYLNKTCYNGLYRVNRKGQFNTPYGNNKRSVFCDEEEIKKAAVALAKVRIECADYHDILTNYAQEGDFIFLDPPYVPISKNADFKRYTKEQFSEDEQRKLAEDVRKLHEKGCKIMLTNSNHPLVHELYNGFHIQVFETKRMINKNGNKRTGEDIIVTTY